jgi:hypothetical protein
MTITMQVPITTKLIKDKFPQTDYKLDFDYIRQARQQIRL